MSDTAAGGGSARGGGDMVAPADVRARGALAASAGVLIREVVAAGGAIGWVDPPDVVDVQGMLDAVADAAQRGDAHVAVVVDGGEVVAFGYWQRYERETHRLNADVQKVAVHPSRRGEGLGRRVMNELVAAARRAGFEWLTLDVRGDNSDAIALYESLGFARYGKLRDFIAVRDVRYDKLFYVLDLRADAASGGR